MKINTKTKLKSLNGELLKDTLADGKTTEITLGSAIINALLVPVQNEKGEEKVKKYELGVRIHQNDEIDLTAEEAALVKKRIGDVYGPIVVGQVFRLIENKEIGI